MKKLLLWLQLSKDKRPHAMLRHGEHLGWHHVIACWWAAFFAVFIAARFLSAWDASETAGLQDPWLLLRGTASDINMAALIALCAVGLATIRRWAPYALLAITCLLLAGNREYVSEWQSNISFLDVRAMLEPDFVRGSVLTLHLGLTACVLLLIGAAKAWWARKTLSRFMPSEKIFWTAWLLALMQMAWPANPPQMWVQQNIFEENIRQTVNLALPGWSVTSQKAQATARRMFDRQYRQELQGELQVSPQPGVNVLMIVVESMSGATIDRGWMPYLKKLGEENLSYPQLINPNITTARGLYALLCGEITHFGRFGGDRIARHIATRGVTCLPKILSDRGYKTIYLQGADLDFQDKGHLMPNMGFKAVHGKEYFKNTNTWFSTWGPDDFSLYKEVETLIEATEASSKAPWLISVMTVGTHHPYNVDPSFEPTLPLKERGFRFADKAIAQLVEWLETTGRLDNTLVIIAGDESRESRKAPSRLASVITRNQGTVTILTPQRDRWSPTDIYLQSDVPLSVLDYLGIDPPSPVPGRSLFRQYDAFRPVTFAEYGQSALYALWHPGEFVICETKDWRCRQYDIGEKSIFDANVDFDHFKVVENVVFRALMEINVLQWKDR